MNNPEKLAAYGTETNQKNNAIYHYTQLDNVNKIEQTEPNPFEQNKYS